MKSEERIRLPYTPPYDWPHVRNFLATRAIAGVECVGDDGYARTSATAEGPVTIRVRPIEGEDVLELRVAGAPPAALGQAASVARRAFDLDADPVRVAVVLRRDRALAPLVARWPGLRLVGAWDPFECAVRAVLGQQVSVSAGRTLAARLVARAGETLPQPESGLTHLFPSPAALAGADLGGLGITGARIGALRALARAVLDGTLDFAASTEDVTARLVALPGFGHWTAQYVAMRALGHADALPVGDLVLRRMAADGAIPLTAATLAARAESWRPWRGYATFHLWRAAAERR